MEGLTRLDMDPMHCKSRHAHGKPFVGRLHRSLKDYENLRTILLIPTELKAQLVKNTIHHVGISFTGIRAC